MFTFLIWIILILTKVKGQVVYINESNQLTSFPLDIPPDVNILNLGLNNLTQILNTDLHQFTDLQEINLTANNITTVEDRFLDATIHQGLEVISLVDNSIEVMPILDGFGMLKILNISSNMLQTITLGKLDNLTELVLKDNDLNAMPMLTHLLPLLETLDLLSNPIPIISASYFLNTSALKSINLRYTSLVEFDCSGLFNLQYINLDNTYLREFPNITDCFSSLKHLTMRFLSRRLTIPGIDKTLVFGSSLEPRVSQSLWLIHIRDTYIGDLPSWFLYALPNLHFLDLKKTNLKDMPDISTNYK